MKTLTEIKKVETENNYFAELGLTETTLPAIKKKGFTFPTPIQKITIPLLLENRQDLVAQAQTGTGKTAAFGLPLIELLQTHDKTRIRVLVLVPTRELALQVTEEISSYSGKTGISCMPIYGGQSYTEQFKKLRKGPDIVIGTPGRIIDHIGRGTLKLHALDYVVLDEADEMLNMGFIGDIEEILKSVNSERRMLMFSATMPERVLQIAQTFMGTYRVLKDEKATLTTNLTEQLYFEVISKDRVEALCRIIEREEPFYGIVFCRTRVETNELTEQLNSRGYDAHAIHGDISQSGRESILRNFRTRKNAILIATDVAARGIDVADLTHVVNYSMPQSRDSYVHRIGRTGRAGKQGRAITFITPAEYGKLKQVQRTEGVSIKRDTVPKPAELIFIKRNKIKQSIIETIEINAPKEQNDLINSPNNNNKEKDKQKSKQKKYRELAQELLQAASAQDVVTALLQTAYPGVLEENGYTPISEVPAGGKQFKSKHITKRNKRELSFSKYKDHRNKGKKNIKKKLTKK